MDKRSARFHRRVEEHFGGRPGRGARYSASLRCEALEIVEERLASGERLSSIAGELGVGVGTLQRWLEIAPSTAPGLRSVELVEIEQPCGLPLGAGAGLSLITAEGHRVEGLALSEVALLLSELR